MKSINRAAFVLCAGLMLTGCAYLGSGGEVQVDPSMQASLAEGAKLDPEAARTWLNRYRRSNGLDEVVLDDDLMKLAEQQARAMAADDRLSHESSAGKFTVRLARSDYDAGRAVENLGMGYRSVQHQFEGWRKSTGHNKNMLLESARHMGIAAVRAQTGKQRVYIAMVLAQPAMKRTVVAPQSGAWGAPLPKLW